MTVTLYLDCFAGISGDMTVGALLDLGIDSRALAEEYKKLALEGYRVSVGKTKKLGISATDFEVVIEDPIHHHEGHDKLLAQGPGHSGKGAGHSPHRNLHDIVQLIGESNLSEKVKKNSIHIFETLAGAEAKVHDAPLEEIHFHEVGAVDSILDIVGTCICLDWLGVEEIYASPLHLGGGFLHCAHGILPAESPAAMELLKGVPVYSRGIKEELVTPTGAAIVKTLVREFMPLPEMTIENIGYGAGLRDLEIPNLLRIIQANRNPRALLLLETNIDDMNPEVYSHLFPLLMDNGALDVYLTQIIMKKNRPGILLSVLCPQNLGCRMEEILLTETTTLGVRRSTVERVMLHRRIIQVPTRFGELPVKVASRGGQILKYAPEYEECRQIAMNSGLPLNEVYHQVRDDADKYFINAGIIAGGRDRETGEDR